MTIPKRLHATIHTFCSDMWKGYLNAIADFIDAHPDVKAKVVIDRFQCQCQRSLRRGTKLQKGQANQAMDLGEQQQSRG